jgi:hypothetical protein
LQSLGDCKRAKGNGIPVRPAGSHGRSRAAAAPAARLPLALVLALIALTMLAVPAARAGTYSETVTFDPADLEFSRSGGFDMVSLEGGRWLDRPGEPRLPLEPYRVALPAGARVTQVGLTLKDSLLIAGSFLIPPCRTPQPISLMAHGRYVPAGDSVYLMSEFYPATAGEYVGTGCIDGTTICDMLLYPLRYNPVTGALVLSREIEISIDYESDAAGMRLAGKADTDMIEGLVSSERLRADRPAVKDMLLDSPYAKLSETDVEYLIIADSSLAGALEPLVEWKTRKGVPTALVTLNTINVEYTGADLQERIRNCIADYDANHGTEWVLLGGDTGTIPERRLYVPLSDKTSIPSDLYYADLDGTYNDDGDLRWGEIPADGVDMYSDVYVGRAPVSTAAEAAVFVGKVLAYEGVYGSPGDHLDNMLFLAEILWGTLGDLSDPEYTDGGVAKNMIEACCVPESFTVQKLYESSLNLTYEATVAALNEGQGMVNINCHGAVGSISLGPDDLPAAGVLGLTNGPAYGLIYATSCMVGAYDQTCIGEAWLRSPAGGGFFIGNSRYGWGVPGAPGEGPSDCYDRSFFESIFTMGLENLGKAHAYAKNQYVAESRYDEYYRYVMYGLNLFGDPETPLWTAQPAEIAVLHPAGVLVGPSEFAVVVTSGGSPAAGATVCLYKPGDVYMVGGTDALGNATFYIEPAEPGTLCVTVTGGDYLPYLGSSIVEDASMGVPDGAGREPFALRIEPNPFSSRVALAVSGAPGERIQVDIFDIRGRRVAGLDLAVSGTGTARAAWEGVDSEGRRVAPGIYVIKVASEDVTLTKKVLLVR